MGYAGWGGAARQKAGNMLRCPAHAEPDAVGRGWQRLIGLGQLGTLLGGEKLLDDEEAALLQRRPVSRGFHARARAVGPSRIHSLAGFGKSTEFALASGGI
eukprot:scaffold105678_cov69-Phaeocystis_antarctica.AAC.2